MKKFLFFISLLTSTFQVEAQTNFLNFDALLANGGGIAAYCINPSHNTTYLQSVYDSLGHCVNGNTYGYYNIASRNVITNNNAHYGARLNASNGFPNFTAALAANGFNLNQIKIKFTTSNLGTDAFGTDWFSSGTTETRFYKGGTFNMQLNGSNLISGNMPNFQLNINYQNGTNCSDDLIAARSDYAAAINAAANSPINVQNVAAALLQDIGNRGLAFDFSTLATAIQNQFLTNFCNAPFNIGAYYECNNGKILLSDFPLAINNNNNLPAPNNCTTASATANSTSSGNWMHITDNGNPVVSILDNANMGLITTSYFNTVNIRRTANGTEYLGRNFTIVPSIQPNAAVRIRLYFTRAEWNTFIAENDADGNDANFLSDLVVTRMCGNACNNLLADGYGEMLDVVGSGVFNNGYYVDIKSKNLGAFYLHSGNEGLQPLAPAPIGVLINCAIGSNAILATNVFNTVWTSSTPAVATVSSIGLPTNKTRATAMANGATNIYYEIVDVRGCKTPSSPVVYTVDAVTNIPAITGANNVCVGSNIQLSNAMLNGVWSSLNNRATIGANTGLLSGTNASGGAPANIRYTITTINGCSGFVNTNITVNAIPNVPSIGYAAGTVNPQTGPGGAFCTNRTFTVVGNPNGGVWSKTGVLTIGAASGIVNTGLVAGVGSITYTVTTNGCSNSRTIGGLVVGCAARGVSVNNGQLKMDNGFTVYPNPAHSFININVETLVGAGSIVVTDLYGKQIATQTLSMGTNRIDVSKLSRGMYFVSMITSEGKTTKKLVVE